MQTASQKLIYLLVFFFLTLSLNAHGQDRRGRLGVGLSNQLARTLDAPAISMKFQQSRAMSLGGMFAMDNDDQGGYGAGVKLYRHLFEEPQLHFYAAAMAAYVQKKQLFGESDLNGFQVDLTLGSEFSFTGLQSLGFSFEFGLSMNKLDDFTVQIVGDHIVHAAVHFYL